MNHVQTLIQEVSAARQRFVGQIAAVTEAQAHWQPAPAAWSITDNAEHLFWAEQGGIVGMWKTLHAIRAGRSARTTESPHQGLPIDRIIDLTWQPKEVVPAVAAPRFGGPLAFWVASLQGLQSLLEAFGRDLDDSELRLQAHPHPISGPLDFQQRLEFLRFHLDRHRQQVARLLGGMP